MSNSHVDMTYSISRPKVSVIMPCHNNVLYIEEAVDSVIRQTYQDWELIIVDDCSTNPQMKLSLQSLAAKDKRIRIASTSVNSGPGVARNIGIQQAKGPYLAFLDSDDYWYPTKLEQQIAFMQANHCAFSCTYYEMADKELSAYKKVTLPERISFRDMLYGYAVGMQGIMLDKACFAVIELPKRRHAEDWQLWLRLLKQTDAIYVLPQVLWKYRQTPGSVNKHKVAIAHDVVEVYQQEVPCSHFVAILRLLFQYMPHLIKRKLLK